VNGRNFIDGRWRDAELSLTTHNPSDLDEMVGQYAPAGLAEAEEALAAARRAQPGWRAFNMQARADILRRVGDALYARADEIGALLSREEGKALREGVGEVQRAAMVFHYYAAEVVRHPGHWYESMRAGHNIHSGLQVLADETPDPLGGEFKKLVEDLTLGSTVAEALHTLGDRVPLLDLRFFSTGVILQRDTGANIVTVMENLSAVIRERLQLRARLRAHTAQQRFSAGLLCSLPVVTGLAFYFVRYEYISALWLTESGSRFLIYGIISEIVGIMVIRRVGSVRL